ncbi:MopE-related protein [Myxococcota bacterium]
MRRTACSYAVAALSYAHSAAAAPINLTGGANHKSAAAPSVSLYGSHRWVAWIEYAYSPSSGSEHVRMRAVHYLDGNVVEGTPEVATGRIMSPVALACANGDAWFFWIRVDSNGGRLEARRRTGGAWQSEPIDVSSSRAGYPAARLDIAGQPWVAWEAYEGEGVEIRVAKWTGSSFSSPTRLSQDAVNAYAPAMELDAEDALWVAWHAYVDHTYDIFTRRMVGQSWQPIWRVTDAFDGAGSYLGYHVQPTMSRGCCGIMWFGWLSKSLDVLPPGAPAAQYSLVQDRRIQVRRLQPTGAPGPVHQVPVPFGDMAHTSHQLAYAGPEAPVLVAGHSKIAVFFRVLSEIDRHYHWRIWMQNMNVNTGSWLANPFDVAEGTASEGYPEPCGAAKTDRGFLVAWQRDFRNHSWDYLDGFNEPESDILLNEISNEHLGVATAPAETLTTYDPPLAFDQPRREVALRHLGSTYRLYWGDLHNHSAHSSCVHDHDDLMQEDTRRIRDVAALDFLAHTDHGEQLSHHDWYNQRNHCALHNGAFGLTTLLGYEHTNYTLGHQNVIWSSCDGELYSARSFTTPEQLWNLLPPGQAITIPHSSTAMPETQQWDMRRFDGAFNRLFEIYQMRGSFECYWCTGVFRDKVAAPNPDLGLGFFQDALAVGHRMGVIASPDHSGMWGLAGVYAESHSQADIFDALWNRRSFGVSNAAMRLTMELRADGHLMGEEYELHGDNPTAACPVLYGRVHTDYIHPIVGPAVIEEVKIYRVPLGTLDSPATIPSENGEIFELEPGANEVTFTFHDASCPRAGSAAYYLRAIQSDVHDIDEAHRPSMGWTSPVFVDWTPGSVSRNAAIVHDTLPAEMNASESQTATVRVQNTGDIAWTGKEGYFLSVDPAGLAIDPGSLDEYLLPGENHDFEIVVDAPGSAGGHTVVFQMEFPAGKFGQPFSAEVVVLDVVCTDGETRPCGTDVGACALGDQMCSAGAWGTCTGGIDPQPEACNGSDDDCDGSVPVEEADTDMDGYRPCQGDCLDDDASVNPGQSEVGGACTDGADNDCDGAVDDEDPDCVTCSDQDQDGFATTACGGDDCNDGDPAISPAANEVCDDEIDNDCDSLVDEDCGEDPIIGACQASNVPGGALFCVLLGLALFRMPSSSHAHPTPTSAPTTPAMMNHPISASNPMVARGFPAWSCWRETTDISQLQHVGHAFDVASAVTLRITEPCAMSRGHAGQSPKTTDQG